MKTNKNTTVRYNTATHLTSDTGDASALMSHKPPAGTPIWPSGAVTYATPITELRAGHAVNVLKVVIVALKTYPRIITIQWVDAMIKALRGSGEPGTSYTEIKAQLERLIEKNENQANIISDLDKQIGASYTEALELADLEIATLRANYSDAISERNAAEQSLEAARAMLREQKRISDGATGAHVIDSALNSMSVFDHLANVIKERDAQAKQIADQASQITYLNWHVGKFTGNAERDAEQIKTLTRERDKYQHAYQQQKQAEQYRADNNMPEAVRSTVDELQGNLRRAFKELAQEQADHKATSSTLEFLRGNMRDIRCMVNDSIGEEE